MPLAERTYTEELEVVESTNPAVKKVWGGRIGYTLNQLDSQIHQLEPSAPATFSSTKTKDFSTVGIKVGDETPSISNLEPVTGKYAKPVEGAPTTGIEPNKPATDSPASPTTGQAKAGGEEKNNTWLFIGAGVVVAAIVGYFLFIKK